MSQPVLPLMPADATPVGPIAGLVETSEGMVVFIAGMATFAFADDDVVGRRLAAVQLVEAKIASVAAVTAAFGVQQATLWRWRAAYTAGGVAGLIDAKTGPKGPSKLTADLAGRIRALNEEGMTLAAIAERAAVSTATVRVALGRVSDPARRDDEPDGAGDVDGPDADSGAEDGDSQQVLPILTPPAPRRGERALAPGLLT